MSPMLSDALNAATSLVAQLDFTLQTRKMTSVMGWSTQAVELMEAQYKKFLALSAALQLIKSDTVLVPNRPIDEFWHAHITDTEKYHNDCMLVFGQYFHHFPYFGIQGDEDKLSWEAESMAGSSIWREAFGEDLFEDTPEADAYIIDRKWIAELSGAIVASKLNGAAACKRTACKPQKCR